MHSRALSRVRITVSSPVIEKFGVCEHNLVNQESARECEDSDEWGVRAHYLLPDLQPQEASMRDPGGGVQSVWIRAFPAAEPQNWVSDHPAIQLALRIPANPDDLHNPAQKHVEGAI